MPRITMIVGFLLVALGLYGYLGLSEAESRSVTALIPAFFGLPLIGLGALAGKERHRKLAMHIAAAIGLLGALGAARGLSSLPQLLKDSSVLERPSAVAVQCVMFGICVVFVALCVNSFIQARKARAAG